MHATSVTLGAESGAGWGRVRIGTTRFEIKRRMARSCVRRPGAGRPSASCSVIQIVSAKTCNMNIRIRIRFQNRY
jgi:hypothetical protein